MSISTKRLTTTTPNNTVVAISKAKRENPLADFGWCVRGR
jgi:hypothetical protein